MTEYELDHFRSEFDPQTMAESLQADGSTQNKAKNFAILKTSSFLAFSKTAGRVAVLTNNKKESLAAAFTCREELEKWPFERTEVAEVPFVALQAIVKNNDRLDGLVIDPFGKALVLKRDHLSDIDNTLAAAQPRQSLKLKATRDYPIGLPLAVKELCESHKEVYRVWILAARGQQDNEDHKLLVVDFDGKGEDLFPHLAKAVRLYLRQGERLELMKADLRLLQIAQQAARPIYEKA